MKRILIAEDDGAIAELERDYLQSNGFDTVIAADGKTAVDMVNDGSFDLVILDVMLPLINGFAVCKSIRDKSDIPILMVTAKHESEDKVHGLGIGADDYIAKPFDPAELIARVKAHIARYERLTASKSEDDDEIIDLGRLKIFRHGWQVFVDGNAVDMTNKEFELLLFLVSNPNIVFSKEQLFERIWGYEYISDSATVAVHINRLREKIEVDSKNPKLITTIRGAGYRFNRT